MTSGVPTSTSEDLAFHPAWLDRWAPELDDVSLKKMVFSDDRLIDRVAQDLFSVEPSETLTEDNSDLKDRLTDLKNSHRLRTIGVSWLAPRLFYCLFDPETRMRCGNINDEDVENIIRYRDHAPIEKISLSQKSSDFIIEGRRCLIAWLLGSHLHFVKRYLLAYHPSELEGLDHDTTRAELFGSFLRDTGD